MAFHRVVLYTAVMAAAFCKKPEIHTPDEELVAFWQGDDLPAVGGIFSFKLDFLYDLLPAGPSLPSLPILPSLAMPVGLGLVSLFAALALTTVIAYFGNAYLTKQWMNTWQEVGVPSPPCATIMGNSWQIRQMGGLRASIKSWYEQFGKVFGIHIGRQPVLVVADAQVAEDILDNTDEVFNERYGVPRALQKHLKEKCLFLTQGHQWDSLHYILTTAFCPDNLTYMVHRINRCANNLAEYIEDMANDGVSGNKCYNLKETITSYSYDTMAAMILGAEPDYYGNPDDEFFKVMKAAMDSVGTEFCGVSVPGKLRPLKKFFQEKLKERKNSQRKEGMVDFLEIFMHSGGTYSTETNPGLKFPVYAMRGEEIVGTLTHWVLHGHETLVSCLRFLLRVLATFPDYQQIVLAEIENNLKSEEPTYEDLCNLPFLDLVIKEVMRMFPPVQEIWRYAARDITVQGIAIPDRSAILIAVNLIHADADYFLEPENFEPERYFQDSPKRSAANSDLFLSFGSGPRTCVGYEVTLLQMKTAIVHIARKVKLEVWDAQERPLDQDADQPKQVDINLTEEGILRPRSPILLRIEARRPQDVFKLKPTADRELQGAYRTESLTKEKDMLSPSLDSQTPSETSRTTVSTPTPSSGQSSPSFLGRGPGTPYSSVPSGSSVSFVSGTSDSSPDSASTRGSALASTTTTTSSSTPSPNDVQPSLEELLRMEREQIETKRLEADRLKDQSERASVQEQLEARKHPSETEPEAAASQGRKRRSVSFDLHERVAVQSPEQSETPESQEKLETSKSQEKSETTRLQEQVEPSRIQSDQFFDALEMTDDRAEHGHLIASQSVTETRREGEKAATGGDLTVTGTTESEATTEAESLPTTETESLPTTETESLATTETESAPTTETESLPTSETGSAPTTEDEAAVENVVEIAEKEEEGKTSQPAPPESQEETDGKKRHKKRKKKKKKKDRQKADAGEVSLEGEVDSHEKRKKKKKKKKKMGTDTEEATPGSDGSVVSDEAHEKRKKKKKKKKKDRGKADDETGSVQGPSQDQVADISDKRSSSDSKRVSIVLTSSQLAVNQMKDQQAVHTESTPQETEGGEKKKKKKKRKKKKNREGGTEKGGTSDEEAAKPRTKSKERIRELEILPWEAKSDEKLETQGTEQEHEIGKEEKAGEGKRNRSKKRKSTGGEQSGSEEGQAEENKKKSKKKKKKKHSGDEKDMDGTTDEERRGSAAALAEGGSDKKKKKKKKDRDTHAHEGAEGGEKKKKKKKDKQK